MAVKLGNQVTSNAITSNLEQETLSREVAQKSPLIISPNSPLVNGLRQSTLNFNLSECLHQPTHLSKASKKKNQKKNQNLKNSVENVHPSENFSLVSHNNQETKPGTRQKKQLTIKYNELDDEKSKQNVIPKISKNPRGRPTHALRRSLSTSNLPDTHLTEEPNALAHNNNNINNRKLSNSVSPKKQIRSDKHNSDRISNSLQQTRITGFTVRRTARQYAKDLIKQRETDVITAILNNEESGMKVIHTEDKGRGVISTRKFFAGEFVVEYVGDLVSESVARAREVEYKKNPDVGSFMFFFAHGGQRYCVDATEETQHLGRLINHSRLHPTCLVKVVPIDGVPRLALFAKNEILPGEELLYDYGDRDKESLVSHPWLKL